MTTTGNSDPGHLLTNAKKRRGVPHASITQLTNCLKDLEPIVGVDKTLEHAQRMSQKLSDVESEFRTHHHVGVNLIEDKKALAKEQELLDTHDDLVSELSVHVKQVIAAALPSSNESSRRIATCKFAHLQKSLASITSSISDPSTAPSDMCLVKQYKKRTNSLNKDLAKMRDEQDRMELDDSAKLFELQDTLESQVFDCSVKHKKLLVPACTPSEASTPPSENKGVRLLKFDVPTFDGNILNWRSFWEQFHISVPNCAHQSDSEKLVHLQQSLKGGSAKGATEGLSRSGERYSEAIKCLQSRYDRPRLTHKARVQMILEAPSLKEGSGQELRRLHDTAQHLRALKAMDCERPRPFITLVLELKLIPSMIFEWQKHNHDPTTVPHYNELLDFIDMRAQASESLTSSKKPSHTSKPTASFAAEASNVSPNCLLCKTNRHPLYMCSSFKSLPHDRKISIVKSNGICMNYLKPGHFLKQCKSLHQCKTCQNLTTPNFTLTTHPI